MDVAQHPDVKGARLADVVYVFIKRHNYNYVKLYCNMAVYGYNYDHHLTDVTRHCECIRAVEVSVTLILTCLLPSKTQATGQMAAQFDHSSRWIT
jgi:hypothetical protein